MISAARPSLDPRQLDHQLSQLRQQEQQLLQLEQQAFEVYPMPEQRREQLAALLRTEWAWMEQRGIVPSVQVTSLPPAQDPRRLSDSAGQYP
jgi:hypothetical protein